MDPLDSASYFTDPQAASFVDDVQRGNVARVKAALAAGMNPNVQGHQGFRPIYFVFFAKSPEVLKVLLAAGADPNARLVDGNTPLHFSVRNRDPEFTSALLAAGANPNARGENNRPPIHEAVVQENSAHIPLLASAGADLNAIWGGGTPVMVALEVGQWEQARLLIDLGADLNFKNRRGETALDLACQFIRRVPVNDTNRKGIAGVVQSLSRRNLSLPCEAEVARFR
jgi:ankyrin repeat protein